MKYIATEYGTEPCIFICLEKIVGGGIDFLIHLRSPFKDLNPNKWDTRFGGHLKSGVGTIEGVKMEIKEEIGLKIRPEELKEGECHKRNKFPNCEFTQIYFLEYNDEMQKLKFGDGEVKKVKWMDAEDIKLSLKKEPQKWSTGLFGFEKNYEFLKGILGLCYASRHLQR